MEPWTFARAVSFFAGHAGKTIVVRQRGSTLRLAGRLAAFDERAACAMDFVEAAIDLGTPGVGCTLTLHETTALIHVTGGAGETGLFLPVSIPYADLVLEEARAPRAEAAAQAARAQGAD